MTHMTFRRVVTATSADGRGVVVCHENVTAMMVRNNPVDLHWALDGPPRVPNDGAIPRIQTWFREPGALRIHIWTKQPDSTPSPLATDSVFHRHLLVEGVSGR